MIAGKWLVVSALLVLCISLGVTPALAFAPVYTTTNNFTMLDPTGAAAGGTNDVSFTWDGTLKTSVAVSGQVSNATIGSLCPFNGFAWKAHDVAVYGPGTYTVYASCAAKAPGCATGTNPITFTVGQDEIGVHMLFDWGTVSTNKNIDVVNVWKKSSPFGPSPLWTGACGSNPANKVWDLMSKDPGTGINGYPMVDGGFVGFRANFNMVGPVINRAVETSNNNFTMIQPDAVIFGGTNDVRFTWDGTRNTSVAVSGQVSNASISSYCPFFGQAWIGHDAVIYGPGTYTIYAACPAGSPGCGDASFGTITFTVGPGEIGGHLLFYWNGSDNIDVVNVWRPYSSADIWTGACGSNPPDRIWDWMSYDWDGDGVNGVGMIDGPFVGMNANFNLMGNCIGCGVCDPPDCNDNNACTIDACIDNMCMHTPIICNDNNACTTDSCSTAAGCVFTPYCLPFDQDPCAPFVCINQTTGCQPNPIVCNDNNACTIDSCNSATGCVFISVNCNDNNACTTDTCNTATGCVHTPIVCNDNNACTTDSCNSATGCKYTPIPCDDSNLCTTDSCDPKIGCIWVVTNNCDDNNACTADSCDPAKGCVHTLINCNDNNTCTTDTCSPATGCGHTPIANCCNTAADCSDNNACTRDTCVNNACVHTPIYCCDACEPPNTCNPLYGCPLTIVCWPSCNDNNACTVDTCNTATGCVFTPVNCNDNNACTTDTCDPVKGCVHTPIVCNDNNACTIDSCNTATGACVHTPIVCNDNNLCTIDTCNPATGCVFTPIDCNDNNACTIDSCNTAIGCVFTPVQCPMGYSCDPATGNCVNQNPCAGVVCDDNNTCTVDACDTATGACVYTPLPDRTACTVNSQPGTCTAGQCIASPVCPAGMVKSITTRGGGQKPTTVDLQIETNFTVVNDGCVGATASSVTCTPGTIMLVNVKAGIGPMPSSCTWQGAPISTDTLTITCPDATGVVGKLICDNKLNGGKDVDRITITVQ